MAVLQFKRGSTATLQNIIPAAGEPVWDKELQKLKVGDGTSYYKDLPYVGEFEVEVDGKSIVYSNDNLLTLFGFENAQTNQVPAKGADGSLVWVTMVSQEVINALNDRLDYIDGKVDTVDSRVDELFSDIFGADGIESRLDTLEENLGELEPDRILEALETVEQYEDRLDDLHADVGELKDDVADIKAKDIEQDARIEALEQGSGIDMDKIYTTDDVMIIDGGTEKTVIIEDHRPVEIWED